MQTKYRIYQLFVCLYITMDTGNLAENRTIENCNG